MNIIDQILALFTVSMCLQLSSTSWTALQSAKENYGPPSMGSFKICRAVGSRVHAVDKGAGIEKTRIRKRNLESIISPRFLDLPSVLIGQCQCREMWINFRFAIQCSSGIHTLKRWQKPDSPLTPHSEVINKCSHDL